MNNMFCSFSCRDTVTAAKVVLQTFMNNKLAGLEVDFGYEAPNNQKIIENKGLNINRWTFKILSKQDRFPWLFKA